MKVSVFRLCKESISINCFCLLWFSLCNVFPHGVFIFPLRSYSNRKLRVSWTGKWTYTGDFLNWFSCELCDCLGAARKWNRLPDWHVPMFNVHFPKLVRLYCPEYAEWSEMTEQIDWLAKQPSQMICASEDLKCWGAWDITFWHIDKDIRPSIAWRRESRKEEALDDLPWQDERGPSSVRRTLELFRT